MNNDDRYHTTSWDGREVQRQTAGEDHRQEAPRPAPKKKKKKRRRTNPLLAIILWVAIVGASSAILAGVGWMLANDFAALNKDPKEVDFTVEEAWIKEVVEETQEDGSVKEVTRYDMEKVAAALKEEGLIEYEWFFRLFSWVYHGDEKISQGRFTLNTEMDYMALIRGMRAKGGAAVTVDVTIPEGYTVGQIIELLAENKVGSVEDLTETAKNFVFEDYDFIDNENLGSISRLEGYLFPDTYDFYVGARTELAFASMLNNFQKKVYTNEDLSDLFENSAYSEREILIMASLIERETDGTDRRNISSVIHNRLEKGGETGRLLQIDASLVYAAGRAITQEDYTTLDSPYNLYLHEGLPPSPIANPGLAAIQAALEPADTNYYFYVLMGDKHVFSETLAQHNRNVAAAAEAAAQAEE